jgi:protein-L-isoaspartate(D-aspartate) O-methyltransferase
MIDFARSRRLLVDNQLRTREVTEADVLDAFATVPRELFVPSSRRAIAYSDAAIPLDAPGRSLAAPTSTARLVQLVDPADGDRVLDIGCATGYAAAVMSLLGARVVALEEDAALADHARAALAEAGRGDVEVVTGALAAGHPAKGPYDAILIEGSGDEVPQTIFDQLADGGRLVVTLGHGLSGRATLFRRTGKELGSRAVFDVAMPPLPGFQRAPRFDFAS